MGIKSNVALMILALAGICLPAAAQAPAQNPPTAQQGPPIGPRGRGFAGPGPSGPENQAGREGFGGGRMGRRFGQHGPMGRGGRFMGRQGFGQAGLNDPAIRQRLGITSAQVAKIREQDADTQKSQILARANLEVKRIELNELLAADNPNHDAINAKLQEVSAAQMASEKAAIDNQLALREILTPAQRQQLQQLRENGFQPGGAAQAPPGGARGGRGPGQRGTPPPPPNRQGQAPPSQ